LRYLAAAHGIDVQVMYERGVPGFEQASEDSDKESVQNRYTRASRNSGTERVDSVNIYDDLTSYSSHSRMPH
jgi:hypothetical protein